MDLTNSMDIQDWNLLMDIKLHFELKDSKPDIYFWSLEIQVLIKATVGTSFEDDTYTSLADPILKQKREDLEQGKEQCKIHRLAWQWQVLRQTCSPFLAYSWIFHSSL